MPKLNLKAAYIIIMLAALAAAAILYWDLLEREYEFSVMSYHKDSNQFLGLLPGYLLLVGILVFSIITISSRPKVLRDLLIILVATLFGFLAEYWGTSNGLWRYYTHEVPPPWIVPAWPLGALVIDRTSIFVQRWLSRFLSNPAKRILSMGIVISIVLLFVLFSWPQFNNVLTVVLFFLVVLTLSVWRKERDLWFLLTGIGLVFFADLWGTTSSCWSYYFQSGTGWFGFFRGISFGMTFDSAIALSAVKCSDGLMTSFASLRNKG